MTKRLEIIEAQKAVYRPAFLEHGDSPKATRANDKETQRLRFYMLTHHLLSHTELNSIEDIGCGICDLYAYLNENKFKFSYSGTEIVEEMIALARDKYPGISVQNRDILTQEITEKYDYVVMCGTMYIPGEVDHPSWKEFCFALLERTFSMCNKAIAFNFLTTYRTFTDPSVFYLDPSEAIDFCSSRLSRFVELKHCYPLYEGTITVYREEYINSKYGHPAYAKYFQGT